MFYFLNSTNIRTFFIRFLQMISAEAPILFAKACEMFIAEMTIKGYYNAEKLERKTLQRKDIATAIARTETYDFLIDTIPKDELK